MSSDKQYIDKINKWFTKLDPYGNPGTEGLVYTFVVDNIDDVIIIKANDTEKNNYKFIHEIFIGLYGTNKLRKYIPNFSFILGGLRCSPPRYIPREDTIYFAESNKDFYHILYEFIQGNTLKKELEKIEFSQFLNIFLQILFALQFAFDKIKFTHYDLHYENIIIRTPFDSEFFIPYIVDDVIYYIKTNCIATIIDYGFSYIQIDNINYGRHDLNYLGINADKSFPMYDIYKLLLFSMKGVGDENSKIFQEMVKIFEFFSTEDPKIQLNELSNPDKNLMYNLPSYDKYLKFEHIDLINYIMENFDTSDIVYDKCMLKKGSKILQMNEEKFKII
jgi:serine/threonine protein kinase